MSAFIRLPLTLAAVAAAAAGALALTYETSREAIEEQKLAMEQKALAAIFRDGFARAPSRNVALETGETVKLYEVFLAEDDTAPSAYAVTATGRGYNSGVPIELLVGFVRARDGEGWLVAGWAVVKSEETPGLGEKIKDRKAPATWLEGGPFAEPPADFDPRTHFQKQFAGRDPKQLGLEKDGDAQGLDAITAATITSRGVVQAVRNAHRKLTAALAPRGRAKNS